MHKQPNKAGAGTRSYSDRPRGARAARGRGYARGRQDRICTNGRAPGPRGRSPFRTYRLSRGAALPLAGLARGCLFRVRRSRLVRLGSRTSTPRGSPGEYPARVAAHARALNRAHCTHTPALCARVTATSTPVSSLSAPGRIAPLESRTHIQAVGAQSIHTHAGHDECVHTFTLVSSRTPDGSHTSLASIR